MPEKKWSSKIINLKVTVRWLFLKIENPEKKNQKCFLTHVVYFFLLQSKKTAEDKRCKCYCVVFFFLSSSFVFIATWFQRSAVRSEHCNTITSAGLARLHQHSHTQNLFLMPSHTCRGYEQGINITRSTHFHLTLASPFAFPPLSLFLSLCFCLAPSKPSENIGGSLYWLQCLGFSLCGLKCHRLPDVSLKSPVPPLAVAPGYYYPPLKEWQSGPRRCDTSLCGWSCSAVSSQRSQPIR